MATTYNFAAGTTIAGAKIPIIPTPQEDRIYVLRNIVDFAKQNLAGLSTDVAQVLNIPAGTTVMTAWIRVITAESVGATCTLGVGTSAAEWGTALDCTSAAGSILGATNDWVPLHFTSADTLDIVTGGATFDAFKCEVVALCLKALDTY